MGSSPGSGRHHGVGNGNLLQYSCLENSMDRGAWLLQSTGSQSDMTEHTHTHTFEKVIMDRVLFNVLHVLLQSSQ